MFLPLDRKPNWRNPPLVTLLILTINVLFFYIWQGNDNLYATQASQYYMESGLYKTELKKYEEFRHTKDKLSDAQLSHDSPLLEKSLSKMLSDGDFQNKLAADKIIKPGDSNYENWHDKRAKYDYLHNQVISYKYGLVPSRPSLLTFFTSMFLHVSNLHLWGNMIFFILTGYIVEMVLGSALYLFGYLLSGLAANWFYVLLYPHSAIPGVGASGAIAGIMGMYVIIFGMRKVNFMYFMFVYFDYITAPAIILFPVFILYQLIIQFGFHTNVNVAAHIGGLFGGALFAGILKFIPGAINIAYVDEKDNEQKFHREYQQAQQLFLSMKIDEARAKFESLLKQRPGDVGIKQQLYTIAKYNPASEAYHHYAFELMTLSGSDQLTMKIVHNTFLEYASKAKPKPRWTLELMASLVIRFTSAGFLDDAEKIINFLLKTNADYKRNPEGLAALAKYFNGRDKTKMEHYRNLLIQLYPDSNEARHFRAIENSASD